MKNPTDQTRSKSSLADISHLFLSSIRQKQGGKMPVRTPPAAMVDDGASEQPIRMVQPEPETQDAEHAVERPPVRVLLASHLGARHADSPRRYAASLAAGGQRVGLIQIDAGELRISTFDPHAGAPESHQAQQTSIGDGRALRDCLNELSCDLGVWIICPANPRSAEAKQILANADNWVLLSACDDDAVVASYRLLKGLAGEHRPRLTLATLDSAGSAKAEAMHRKLAGVCRQFLNLTLDAERPVAATPVIAEVPILTCGSGDNGKAALHWTIVAELAAAAPKVEAPAAQQQDEAEMHLVTEKEPAEYVKPAGVASPARPQFEIPTRPDTPTQAYAFSQPTPSSTETVAEIIELEEGTGLIDAMLKHLSGQLVECPVRPPMLPESRLAVSRDRRLVLLASAGPGLAHLRSVAQAYRWLCDNRPLVGMALPQFSLDAERSPLLRLLIDYRDMHAGELSQLLRCDTVCIDAYRKVKWGARTGLLMEAA